MFKSQPIEMIDQGKQISAIKLVACYIYKDNGAHTNGSNSMSIKIHGIDKTGSSTVIAECPLETKAGYVGGDYAAQISTSIKVVDYPFICWSYDSSAVPQFVRFTKQPSLMVEIKEVQDILDDNVATASI